MKTMMMMMMLSIDATIHIVTPWFFPVALDVYDVYIVNNHGVELKAKAPPLIGYALFRVEMVTNGISGHVTYISSFVIM